MHPDLTPTICNVFKRYITCSLHTTDVKYNSWYNFYSYFKKNPAYFADIIPISLFVYSAIYCMIMQNKPRLINVAVPIRPENLKTLDYSNEITDVQKKEVCNNLITVSRKEINYYFSIVWIICPQKNKKLFCRGYQC